MPKPPINPIKLPNGKNGNYFQMLCMLAKPYLDEDGISLNFEGYSNTIEEYTNLSDFELEKAWGLAKDLNAWSEYLSDVANLIQKMYLDSETAKLAKQAESSILNDATKVANGDRLSNKDEVVIRSRKKRNALKSFYDELTGKIDFLNRAYYHCKSTYDLSKRMPVNNVE